MNKMNKGIFAAALMTTCLLIPRYVRAHEGHTHKVMGTVATRHENHLEVKATDGKTSTITLNEKTKILRGTTKVKIEDIKDGERIVVSATETKGKDGTTTLVATQVTLAK
jgi:4-hydroxy-3-methylbut-2-enyl diphosphate reductase IspH